MEMEIFKDNNNWNEKSIVGFIAFAIMCVIMIVDLVTGWLGRDLMINELIEPDSHEERQTINHEMRHATDMKIGKLAYEDDYITYNGEDFPRMDINGVDSILVDGKWKEAGDTGFPWEDDANNGSENI